MIHIAVCDDDLQYLDQAERLIREAANRYGLDIQIRKLSSLTELMHAAEDKDMIMDLLFLDIEFENENSFEYAARFTKEHPRCQLVFLTNHLTYASDAYEVRHLYFVIKDEFEERIEKILKAFFTNEDLRIPVRTASGAAIYCPGDIYAVERQRRGSSILTKADSDRTNVRFEELCQKLDFPFMVRCHNSFIVNLQHVKQYHTNSFILSDETEIPISRSYQQAVREKVRSWHEIWV